MFSEDEMSRRRHGQGFTLVELMIVTAIASVVVSAGVVSFNSWASNQRAKTSARQIQDLLMVGRAEAIRTGVNHIAIFDQDVSGNDLMLEDGVTQVAALLIQDVDGDGRIDSGERRHHVNQAPAGTDVAYGRSFATTLVPNDTGAMMGDPFDGTSVEGSSAELASAGNFRHPITSTTVNSWVLFAPDGTPRSVVPQGPGISMGSVGSGDGAIYVTNGVQDFAVVMAPLGGTRLLRWDSQNGTWR